MNIITKIIITINRMIDSLGYKTADTIKNVFYGIVFILMIIGAIYGIQTGRDAAIIKSSPLIESTNQTFEIDVLREKKDGSFSSMLDSEIIKESENKEPSKRTFPSQERLEPNIDKGIIELERDKKIKVAPAMDMNDRISESEFRYKENKQSDVKPIKKKDIRQFDNKDESIPDTLKEDKEPLKYKSTDTKSDTDSTPIKEKKKIIKRSIKNPEPINRDTGIIQN